MRSTSSAPPFNPSISAHIPLRGALDQNCQSETGKLFAIHDFGHVTWGTSDLYSEGTHGQTFGRYVFGELVHGHSIANSEPSVNNDVRRLRRAFASGDLYHSVMRLKLKELRERRGWTQEEVAGRAGISKSFYSEIESGKKAANSRRLQKFAEVFQVPVFELIDDFSIDDALLDHLQTLQHLDAEDRKAVIRHALSLASGKEPR